MQGPRFCPYCETLIRRGIRCEREDCFARSFYIGNYVELTNLNELGVGKIVKYVSDDLIEVNFLNKGTRIINPGKVFTELEVLKR